MDTALRLLGWWVGGSLGLGVAWVALCLLCGGGWGDNGMGGAA